MNGAARTASPLTAGSLLARNTLWTLLGQLAPLIAAMVAIPILIRGMGTERFGVLALAWALIGYMGLLDLGLGRALTQRVAERLGAGREQDLHREVTTSLALMGVLGAAAGAILLLLADWMTGVLRVPDVLRDETRVSFRWIALAVPFVVLTAGYAGVLSACQRFRSLNAIRIPSSIFSFAGPLVVLTISNRLDQIVLTLVAGRIAGTVAHVLVTHRAVTWLAPGFRWTPAAVGSLARMGGWMTVSNLIGPLMVQMDRFLVGTWISLAAVAYYATPYEIATRLWIVAAPIVTVLFPAFGTALASDRNRAALLYRRGITYVWLILCPISILVILFARDGLRLWLGSDFATRSTGVLQWMVVGILANSVAQIAYALIQAAGRARDAAVLHMVELPVYLGCLVVLMGAFGIDGAAWVWCARMAIDALIMLAMAARILGAGAPASVHLRGAIAGALGIAGAFAAQELPLYLRAGYAAVGVGVAVTIIASGGMARERTALLTLLLPGRSATTPAGGSTDTHGGSS